MSFLFLGFTSLSAQSYYPCSCLLPEKYVPAVAATEQVVVRSDLDFNAPLVATMYYGQEKVMLLGLKDSTQMRDSKMYSLVSLSDGTQGWVEYAKIVPCGEGKVIARNTTTFKDKEQAEASGFAFREGEPIIATETYQNLIYVYSKNKTKKGWVSVYDIFSGKDEFQVALQLEKALLSGEAYSRKTALEQLKANISSNMQMYPTVQKEYAQVANASPFPPTPMPVPIPPTPMPVPIPVYAANQSRGLSEKKVVANTQNTTLTLVQENNKINSLTLVAAPKKPISSPNTLAKINTENRALPEKNTKTIVPIAEKPATSRGVITTHSKNTVTKPQGTYLKNTAKYTLLKTTKIAPDKVFSCLHPTLPVGTKVRVSLIENAGYVIMDVVGKAAAGNVEMSDASIKRIFGSQVPQKIEIQYFTISK